MKKKNKIPKKTYYSIGEVSQLLGIRDYVIRFWEKEFEQLKPIISQKGNRRKYSIQDIRIIKYIHFLLHEKGYTIVGAKNQLNIDMKLQSLFFQREDLNFDLNFIQEKSFIKTDKEGFDKKEIHYKKKILTYHEIQKKILSELESILDIIRNKA